MDASALVGRDEELDAVRAFLADVVDGPAALVLAGEPGIGKTVLWEAGVDEARGAFACVLVCRGEPIDAAAEGVRRS
jgi:Cdc6-like AAA superfamily ATPase